MRHVTTLPMRYMKGYKLILGSFMSAKYAEKKLKISKKKIKKR